MGEGNWEKSGKIGNIGKTKNVPELQKKLQRSSASNEQKIPKCRGKVP